MRAAYLVRAGEFELRDVPDPQVPEDGLLLRVAVCGVCGSDLRRWREGPPAGSDGVVPGHEVAGEVIAVGRRIEAHSRQHLSFAAGDRLALAPDVHCGRCTYCRHGQYNLCDDLHLLGITPGYPGGFASLMALSGKILANGIVHPVPASLSDVGGALAEPCSSVLAAHHKAGTTLGDTVAVLGAGPIGCLHALVARARGARVVISEPNARRRELAARFSPEGIIDPSAEDAVERVRAMTGGRGADIAVCANPVAATQSQAVQLVRKGGQVILFGGLPKANPNTVLDGNRIHYGEIRVVGSFSYHPTYHALALDLLARGAVPMDLLVTHSFPLDHIAEAFTAASSADGLKVMVRPSHM